MTRREYHNLYYWQHAERRRAQRLASKKRCAHTCARITPSATILKCSHCKSGKLVRTGKLRSPRLRAGVRGIHKFYQCACIACGHMRWYEGRRAALLPVYLSLGARKPNLFYEWHLQTRPHAARHHGST